MPQAADQSYTALLSALNHGEYPPTSKLPGERELAIRLGVSRVTLRSALCRLEDEGRLKRSPQRGWFVTGKVVGEPPSTLESFSEMALSRGLMPTTHVLEQHVRQATFDEAEQLAIAPAAPVIELRRLRGVDNQLICVDHTVLRFDRAAAMADADLENQSLYKCMEQLCGIHVRRSVYTVYAEAATPTVASLLGVSTGSPILVGSEVTQTTDGKPLLIGVNRYRGDAYRFRAELYRT